MESRSFSRETQPSRKEKYPFVRAALAFERETLACAPGREAIKTADPSLAETKQGRASANRLGGRAKLSLAAGNLSRASLQRGLAKLLLARRKHPPRAPASGLIELHDFFPPSGRASYRAEQP